MNRKFFVCLISVTIISSMMSSGYAQSTLNVRAFINGYLFPNGQTLAIIDPVNAPTLFDTLTVELHSTVNGSILFSQKVLFDIDGYGSLLIPINFFGNSYYLVLNHRNSIETWSSVPILINGTINFDFTSSITQAYGDNLDFHNNKACIYGGDINRNGFVDSIDFMMWDTANTAFAFGYYHICDLNGDGNVDLSDFPPIGNGISLSIKVESPFIVGVNEIETIKRLHAFPNPANKFCNFDLDSTNIYGELSVFTLSGKYKSTMIVNEYNNKIDVSYYPAGMYILKYTSGNEVLSQKLVVEH